MKKYLVISYGDFKDNSKVTYLVDSISEITMTEMVKYKVLENSIIVNFGTNIEFSKLKEYFSLLFERISNFYFIIEQNENTIISLPDNENDSFSNLTSKKLDFNIDKLTDDLLVDSFIFSSLESIKEDLNYIDDEEEEDVLIKKSIKKEYTIDEILDKINEKGISSLTEEENNYLKNLSK